MAESLGICVATKNNMVHVVGLAKAAKAAGKEVKIFMTGEGVHLAHDPLFPQLLEMGVGHVGVCEVSYIANGFQGKPVAGLRDKDFVTQARNAEMLDECDRYVVL